MTEFNIAEVFARDPHTLSDAEFKRLVEELREQRKKFVLGQGMPSKTKAKVPEAVKGLDLDFKL